MKTVVLFGCYLVSCLICAFLAFQFMEERYWRRYQQKWPYAVLYAGFSFLLAGVNCMENPALNYFSWLVAVALWAGILYQETGVKLISRILECEAFFIALAFTETMGVLLVEWLVPYTGIENPLAVQCLSILLSKGVLILFYYKVVRGFFASNIAKNGKQQYMAFFMILVYVSATILAVMTEFFQRLDRGIVAINLACIVFIDLYLLSFLKSSSEKKSYEEKLRMLEQQAKLQYEYYVQQEQKYNETLRILHDVNKHLQTINELAELSVSENAAATKDYAEQIRNTLKPLIPVAFTDNPILNILLSDKLRQTREKGIRLDVNMGGVSFQFMEAMDIVTIFGNLLDNAIEACEAMQDREEKRIRIFAKRVQDMVAVTLENDSDPVTWKGGFPVSRKGENRGIGLLNVRKSIEKYDGSITMRGGSEYFVTEFFVSI